MSRLLHDLRFAIRQLLKQPVFTLVVLVTLALGIGANTAIFSVVYGVLLRPLPYPESGRIAALTAVYGTVPSELGVTWPEATFLQQHNTAFQYLAATTSVGFNLLTGTAADRVHGLRVSAHFFDVLGVHPMLGRAFTAEEDQTGGPDVVVLSYGVWQRLLGGDRGVIGTAVRLDGKPFTVIGVMPADFRSQYGAQVWTTLAQVASTIGSGQNLALIGRVPPGRSMAQADAALRGLTTDYRTAFPTFVSNDYVLGAAPWRSLLVQDVRTPVRVVFGAILFVLLIACANVASLLLGRAAARRRELSVRIALGASRTRIIRQLLTESLLLALAGGVLGLLVATWGLHLLLTALPGDLGGAAIGINGWTLLFTFAIAALTGVVFGLGPAWQATSADPQAALQEGAARSTAGRGQTRVRDGLVVAEVALSLLLLAGAGLMIRTVANLLHIDPGFDADHVASAEFWLTGTRYTSTEAIGQLYQQLVQRAERVPGVRAAAVVEAGLPLERGGNIPIWLDGQVIRTRGGTDFRGVTGGYFDALGTPLVSGRLFDGRDSPSSQPVMLVNQTFARQFLADGPVVGRQMQVGGKDERLRTVVGVVGDVRSFIGSPAQPTVYIPQAQTPIGITTIFGSWFPMHLLVRTSGNPGAVVPQLSHVIREVDPQVPVGQVQTMASVLSQSVALRHFIMLLLGIFAGLAVVLAAVGIYGLIAYVVAQGTRDIGVRLALGARGGDVVRGVMRRGLMLALGGTVLGLVGAVVLTRLLQNQLYAVSATDPVTLGGVAVLLIVVALIACWIPARRAASVDPLVALRVE
jgi:putative ABC transport system permease protein